MGSKYGDMKDMQENMIFMIFANQWNFPDLFSEDNDNILGKFKTEYPETLIRRKICTLKAKTNAYKTKAKEEKNLRGTTRWTLKKI